MDQHNSFFFRLPRELRGKIYFYHTYQEHGYICNPATGKLRLHDGRLIDNALTFTCKRISHELDGLAHRVNTIAFRTQLSMPEAVDIPSDAAMLEHFRWKKKLALKAMLEFTHSLTSDILQPLSERWPNSKAVIGLREAIQTYGTECISSGNLDLYLYERHVDAAQEEEILENLVGILRTQPEFDTLRSIGYTQSHWERWQLRHLWKTEEDLEEDRKYLRFGDPAFDDFLDQSTGLHLYTESTRWKILDWKPDFWSIPTKHELTELGRTMPGRPQGSPSDETIPGHFRGRYYSATAVAIRFLQQLSPSKRIQMRRVIIEEDHPAINHPYTHIRGLIPFLRENPALKVEQRLDVYRTILYPNSYDWSVIESLRDIRNWIAEARNITDRTGLHGSYSLVLHGPSARASQNISNTLTQVAKWQIGNIEYLKQTGEDFDERNRCVTVDFAEIIKEIVDEDSPARFDANCLVESWDPATILREHQGDWDVRYAADINQDVFEEPDGGCKAARCDYWIKFDSFDDLAWWNTLVEQM